MENKNFFFFEVGTKNCTFENCWIIYFPSEVEVVLSVFWGELNSHHDRPGMLRSISPSSAHLIKQTYVEVGRCTSERIFQHPNKQKQNHRAASKRYTTRWTKDRWKWENPIVCVRRGGPQFHSFKEKALNNNNKKKEKKTTEINLFERKKKKKPVENYLSPTSTNNTKKRKKRRRGVMMKTSHSPIGLQFEKETRREGQENEIRCIE